MIVSVTDAEGGGVVVLFYVMDRGNNAVITADVLYEAVKVCCRVIVILMTCMFIHFWFTLVHKTLHFTRLYGSV